ncbi:MAG: hypothetical protein HY903_19250 [Deltaproteobacteria bacterium]|nr:hypothetical protein [Deltaproteobacteria bacterium]
MGLEMHVSLSRCKIGLGVLALRLAACGAGSAPARLCSVGADCASGVCGVDGSCAPGAGDPGGAAGDVDGGDVGAGDSGGVCRPSNDGSISAGEAPFAAGLTAVFRVTTAAAGFSTAPDCGNGTCVWDLRSVAGATTDLEVATAALSGAWFAAEPAFQTATYVTRLADFELTVGFYTCQQTQLGVFENNADALLLLGIVSEHDDLETTKLIYEPPLAVLRWPLAKDALWTEEVAASGSLCGSLYPYVIRQTYRSAVDAVGTVRTPYGDFERALRVNTLVTRHASDIGEPLVSASVMRQQNFVAECFTAIAAVHSEDGETRAEFTGAAAVRRLALSP